jgi:hypothetical protein
MGLHEELSDVDMTRTLIGSKTLTDWQPSLADLRVLVVEVSRTRVSLSLRC